MSKLEISPGSLEVAASRALEESALKNIRLLEEMRSTHFRVDCELFSLDGVLRRDDAYLRFHKKVPERDDAYAVTVYGFSLSDGEADGDEFVRVGTTVFDTVERWLAQNFKRKIHAFYLLDPGSHDERLRSLMSAMAGIEGRSDFKVDTTGYTPLLGYVPLAAPKDAVE